MAQNLQAIRTELGARLLSHYGDDLNVYDYPSKQSFAPFAFVDLPETLAYDLTMGRGSDRTTLSVLVCVTDNLGDEIALQLSNLADGETGVKYALEKLVVEEDTEIAVRVTQVAFRPISVAGTVYAGAVFTVDVAA